VKPLVRKQNSAETVAKRRMSLIAYNNPGSAVAEQYRTIRSNLQFMNDDSRMKSIIVTSPGSGDGKSTTAVNLAVSMANRGDRVLLIDADLCHPSMHLTFDVPNTVGLTDVLNDRAALEGAVYPTGIGKLEVLTSGPVREHAGELLGTLAMKRLLSSAGEQYDVMICDCPPVLEVTDTTLLAHECDGVILVLDSGRTEREAAMEAKKALELARAKILGVVLNKK
jgi:capsular exopolysaccharide synthesis family protein